MRFGISCLVILVTSLVVFAGEGGYSGGGTDYKAMDHDSAWFLGDQEITYCMEINSDFGLSLQQVENTFLNAVKTWQDYLGERFSESDPAFKINFNYRRLDQCNGKENLKLYFGVEDKLVAQLKSKYHLPTAFAERVEYDAEAGMGRGVIWVAQTKSVYPRASEGYPDWTKPYTLNGILLHEVGHVLGLPHVPGTIMEDDLMSTIQYMDSNFLNKRGRYALTHIDDVRFLFLRTDQVLECDGHIYTDWALGENGKKVDNHPKTIELFKQLMGRLPQGPVKAKVRVSSGQTDLHVWDSVQQRKFVIKHLLGMQNTMKFDLTNNLFSRVRKIDGNLKGYSTSQMGYSRIGNIVDAKGESHFVTIGVNVDNNGWPINLQIANGNELTMLFGSNPMEE